MHPDLQALYDRYEHLAGAASRGEVSVEDATATLARSTATDATGAVWRLDVYGALMCAPHPTAAEVPADPTQFVDTAAPLPEAPAVAPSRTTGTTTPGFAGTTYDDGAQHEGFPGQHPPMPGGRDHTPALVDAPGDFTPEPGFGSGGFVGSDPFAGSPFPGSAQGGPAQLTGATNNDPGPGLSLSRAVKDRAAKSLYSSGTETSTMSQVLRYLRENAIVVALVVAGLVVSIAHFTGEDEKPAPDPTTAAETAAPDQTEPQQPLPDEPVRDGLPTQTDPAEPEQDAALPAAGDVSKVRAALESGNRSRIATLVAQPAEEDVAVGAALFAGLDQAGLVLSTGPVAANSDGTVTGTWTITGPRVTDLQLPVTWVRESGSWKLATVPLP